MNALSYLNLKNIKLFEYFTENKITNVTLGISGGIDSAVTLGILINFQKLYPNILQVINAVIAPIYNSVGTSGQKEAEINAIRVCKHFNINYILIPNLEEISLAYSLATPSNFLTPFTVQQTDYWLRPTAFYSISQYIPSQENSILVGTCNLSEWSLGWFSSYLDIFALNPVIDLYKSQIYLVANYFNIPENITKAPPSGGLFSNISDEEALGFTYNDFENYIQDLPCKHQDLISKTILNSEFKRFKFNTLFINLVSISSDLFIK